MIYQQMRYKTRVKKENDFKMNVKEKKCFTLQENTQK